MMPARRKVRIRRLRRSELPIETIKLARFLIGKTLVHDLPHVRLSGRIVETEAYIVGDAASHAFRGLTPRNKSLFLDRGHAYVYFIYGNHYCLNVSCLPDGVPGGVLFRALEPVAGIEQMAKARGIACSSSVAEGNSNSKLARAKESNLKKISSGPGRLAEALEVTRTRDNGKSLVSTRSDLRIVQDGYRVQRVTVTPRIGIVKSAERPLRYFIAGNPFVSGRSL